MKIAVLIYDETKVQPKIMFNMLGNKVMGFAMAPDELPFLYDIFACINQEAEMKTSYRLHFIWLDLRQLQHYWSLFYVCSILGPCFPLWVWDNWFPATGTLQGQGSQAATCKSFIARDVDNSRRPGKLPGCEREFFGCKALLLLKKCLQVLSEDCFYLFCLFTPSLLSCLNWKDCKHSI